MSSNRRPWYPWYPKDFISDEKVQSLSDDAELLYRRALDLLWQANDQQMPTNCSRLGQALARGWSAERFKKAWDEIMMPGFELFKTTDDGQWLYSKRLKHEAEKIEKLCNIRRESAIKGGRASAQAKGQPNANQLVNQKPTHTDTDTDINNTPHNPPRGGSVRYSKSFEDWWALYPKKVGKDAAHRSWKKIGKSNGVKVEKLMDAIKAQIAAGHFRGKDGSDYVPNPATWLKHGRWCDEIKTCSTVSKTSPPVFKNEIPVLTTEQIEENKRRVAELKQTLNNKRSTNGG